MADTDTELNIERPPARLASLLGFLRSETAGGAALIGAALLALVWSNVSPATYDALRVHAGLVNDGLMVLFFLLVGLEIRREMREGQLASLSRIAAPAIAALGGMAVPALIFVAFNWGHPHALRGWAVPVATDIAFSLAVLRVLGPRAPAGLRVFLTALAILDDLGAIVVIALFYTENLVWEAAVGAVLVWIALWGTARAGVRALWPYLAGGVLLWALVARAGVHPTIAGVALAFVVPMGEAAGQPEAPARILERGLGWVVAWVVLPLFGLANAGLTLTALPAGALTGPVVLGIALGLFVGKQVGVFGATRLACATGWVHLPGGLTWRHLYGGSILCGIGFTMSLFIGELAFAGSALHDEVKLAVFAGSIVSAIVGLLVLWRAKTKHDASHNANGVSAHTDTVNP